VIDNPTSTVTVATISAPLLVSVISKDAGTQLVVKIDMKKSGRRVYKQRTMLYKISGRDNQCCSEPLRMKEVDDVTEVMVRETLQPGIKMSV
jgi:hypothetical protein